MGIKRKILSLFSAVVMGATVIFTAAGGEHVQAAETYKVNSSVADVSGNVGDTIEIPITFTTDTPTNSLLGKLRDNKNNVSYYDDTVLKFVGTEIQRNASRTDFYGRRKLLLRINNNQHKRNNHSEI